MNPLHTEIQEDGRMRKWKMIPEEGKFLRVILLEDGKTVHNAFLIEVLKDIRYEVKYFHDTGTALIEFSNHEVVETKEINENLYIDLDSTGNIVSITVEHANLQSNLPNLYYEQIGFLEPQHYLHEKQEQSVKYE